jgi:hypothetical protein
VLTELKKKIQTGQMPLAEALARALPDFRGKIGDNRLIWLSHELQGYPNALDYYQRTSTTDFPPYRVVNGSLKVMDSQGNLNDVTHAIGQRKQFFLAAPVGWLEDSATMPGQITYVELSELNVYMGMGMGNAVCEVSKEQITRILTSFKQSFCALIDEIVAKQGAQA